MVVLGDDLTLWVRLVDARIVGQRPRIRFEAGEGQRRWSASQELVPSVVGGEEGLDFSAKCLVTGANFIDERRTILGLLADDFLENLPRGNLRSIRHFYSPGR